jgi:ligand-binding sensor domain-containing protein
MAGNRVFAIDFDEQGAGWLATDGGVTRVPGPDDTDSAWRAWGIEHGLPGVPLRAIATSRDGRVWAGAADADPGLFVLDPGAETWRAILPEEEPDLEGRAVDGPGAAQVVAIAAGQDGRLWLAHGRGGSERPALSVRDPEGRWRHIRAIGPRENPAKGPRTAGTIALWIDARDGTLWTSGWARGLSHWDGQVWQHYDETHGLCGDTVTAIDQATSGALWVACSDSRAGRGAAVLEPGAQQWRRVGAEGDFLPWSGAIAYVGGQAWLGTNGPGAAGAGLIAVEGTAQLRTGGTTPAANEITAITFGEDGIVWVGTRGSGLMRYDGTSWRRIDRASTDGVLAGDLVTDLAIRGDELWLTAAKHDFRDGAWQDGGISVLDASDGTVLRTIAADGLRLPDGDVGSIVVDDRGVVWIGIGLAAGGPGTSGTTHHGDGLIRHDPQTDSWRLLSASQTQGGLAGNTVIDLAEGTGVVWAATSFHHDATNGRRTGGGVSRVDLDAERWRAWHGGDEGLTTFRGSGAPGGREGAVTGDLRAIHVARDGRVLAGSYSVARPSSLPTLWPYVDAVLNIREGDVWRSMVFAGQGWISAITEDGDGRLWVGTTRGHGEAEEDLAGGTTLDRAVGGLRILEGDQVRTVSPDEGALAGRGVSALAYDPHSGAMWIGTENDGLSVFLPSVTPEPTVGAPTPVATRPPTATPRAAEPTPTLGVATRPPTRTPHPRSTLSPGEAARLWLPLVQPDFGEIAPPEGLTPPEPTPLRYNPGSTSPQG